MSLPMDSGAGTTRREEGNKAGGFVLSAAMSKKDLTEIYYLTVFTNKYFIAYFAFLPVMLVFGFVNLGGGNTVLAVFLLLFPVIYSLQVLVLVPTRLGRQYEKSPELRQAIEWRIDDRQIWIGNGDVTEKLRWEEIKKYSIAKKYTFLYPGGKAGRKYVPHAAFADPEELARFHALVKGKLG